jgi:O-antigen/teichoic acid export membrane protein
MIKLAGVVCLSYTGQLTLQTIAWVFVAGSIVEFLTCILLYRFALRQSFTLNYNRVHHVSMIRESLPQFGITVTNVLVLRADWILLGLIASAATVADYSFAYRCFEFSVLPLAIIGPVLLPRIVRQFKGRVEADGDQSSLLAMLRLEILMAVLIAVVANAGWTPLVDLVTGNKYGQTTRYVFMALSLCTPLLYLNNMFWSINFARGRMKLIFRCILITFLVNLFADLLLIPFFSSLGAAMGFVIGMILQTAVYASNTELNTQGIWKYLAMLVLTGAVAVMASALIGNGLVIMVAAPVLFLLFVFLSGNWPLTAWHHFRKTGLA